MKARYVPNSNLCKLRDEAQLAPSVLAHEMGMGLQTLLKYLETGKCPVVVDWAARGKLAQLNGGEQPEEATRILAVVVASEEDFDIIEPVVTKLGGNCTVLGKDAGRAF